MVKTILSWSRLSCVWCLLVALATGADEADVIFSTPFRPGERPESAKFLYGGEEIGEGQKAFQEVLRRIGQLPPGTSIVWGPNYGRCGSCSGQEPRCLAKSLYPKEWADLEKVVAERRLTLSSTYPGPFLSPVAIEPTDGAEIEWQNYRGPETPHDEVIYLLNRKFMGRGDRGFSNLILELNKLKPQTQLGLPQYKISGPETVNYDSDDLQSLNAKFERLVPFAHQQSEFDRAVASQKLKLERTRQRPGVTSGRQRFARTPVVAEHPTVAQWDAGDRRGRTFVSTGRIVRHDEPRSPNATRFSWKGYETQRAPNGERTERQPETTAIYVLNDVEQGKGVEGFKQAMDKLSGLPPDAVVQVRVCIRTQGPFVCPLIYEGHRHFERSGFEPYFGMFPWLVSVAEKQKLKLEWIPDEEESCGDCPLNK